MFRGKNYKESSKLVDKQALYDPQEALALVCSASKAKFDETVELHVKLGVDGRHADQQVRGAIVLPNGTGKTVRVLCFCPPEQVDEALAAGADYAGGMDLVEKIQKENWFEFDTVIANPKMMGTVGRLGKILGPKGLMPSPKAGTVTPQDQHHPLPHRQGELRRGEAVRELRRAHHRHHQGQARHRQGPVYPLLRHGLHDGPRRQDQRPEAAVSSAQTRSKSSLSARTGSFFISNTDIQ